MKYQIEPIKAVFNKKGFADVAGYACIYHYDVVTGEFITATIRHFPVGVGLPANSCLDAPAENNHDTAIIRDLKKNAWDYPTDHRGKTMYSTKDGGAKTIDFIGNIPSDFTFLAPTGEFDSWNGEKWIEDKEKALQNRINIAKQEQDSRLSEADSVIFELNEAIDLELATDEQKELHKLWRQYRFIVKQIDINNPDAIKWPEQPAQPNFVS